MVDPITAGASALAKAAGSAVTKQLTSKTGLQLGSRDERRLVYARFQAAVTRAYTYNAGVHYEMQLYMAYVGKRRRIPLVVRPGGTMAARDALRGLRAHQAELLQAYLELRLVSNPAPLVGADEVLDEMNALYELGINAPNEQMESAVNRVAAAQRRFTDVCRDDLWYLPQRWQIYRPMWWKARRWRRHATSMPTQQRRPD
ncbi:hypothetical protein ACIQB4_19230 [Streptomyces griseoluteus]|uniref:hypothetical protein n=1 Tax=Streptomyces griseoluteus TaxID=29306 RepID=UPI00381C10E3